MKLIELFENDKSELSGVKCACCYEDECLLIFNDKPIFYMFF